MSVSIRIYLPLLAIFYFGEEDGEGDGADEGEGDGEDDGEDEGAGDDFVVMETQLPELLQEPYGHFGLPTQLEAVQVSLIVQMLPSLQPRLSFTDSQRIVPYIGLHT